MVINIFNGYRLDNKILKVVLLRKGGEKIKGVNVYVWNILKLWINDDLKVFFNFYGSIVNIKIFID